MEYLFTGVLGLVILAGRDHHFTLNKVSTYDNKYFYIPERILLPLVYIKVLSVFRKWLFEKNSLD